MSYIKREEQKSKDRYRRAIELKEIISVLLRSRYDNLTDVALAAYVLSKVSKYNNPLDCSYDKVTSKNLNLSEEVCCAFKEVVNEETWSKLLNLVKQYDSSDFTAVLESLDSDINPREDETTPESIVRLAKRILNIKKKDRVADIGCGIGSFILSMAKQVPGAEYVGYEINTKKELVALLRAEVISANVNIQLKDVFSLAAESEPKEKFQKIFADYPLRTKILRQGYMEQYYEKISKKIPGMSHTTYANWLFNLLICDLLSDNGIAIGVMANGSTWNNQDTRMRQYFVESGLINCVITLPSRMRPETSAVTSLIILSKNNKSVRLIDATKKCQQGRRMNEFSDADIETIIKAFDTDSEISKAISVEELRENEYDLNLRRYQRNEINIENGAPFESVIKSITRGAPCSAAQLDEMVSDEVTNMQYLMLANIHNGVIDEKLPYLSYIEPKFEKYCLKSNQLIMSKNGYPYKIAVAEAPDGQKILANGNLYVIELEEEKANPYYLKAFFESNQGVLALKSITMGATLPNIGVEKLKKLIIPLPDIQEQNRIAQKYQAVLDEIAVLKLRLEKSENHLKHIFDEESEG